MTSNRWHLSKMRGPFPARPAACTIHKACHHSEPWHCQVKGGNVHASSWSCLTWHGCVTWLCNTQARTKAARTQMGADAWLSNQRCCTIYRLCLALPHAAPLMLISCCCCRSCYSMRSGTRLHWLAGCCTPETWQGSARCRWLLRLSSGGACTSSSQQVHGRWCCLPPHTALCTGCAASAQGVLQVHRVCCFQAPAWQPGADNSRVHARA